MKRTGRRYRTGRADDHYDAIVIGSGIGGLCNAALLSKLGKKVCVLEQHYTAGGFTHSYEREGFEWDVGVHYIGEMQKPSMLKRIFDVISDGQLKWADMDPVYDRITVGDRTVDFVAGKNNLADSLKAHFPQEADAIDAYIAHHNNQPKPFIWTKSARDILQKVIRANSRLSTKQNATLH